MNILTRTNNYNFSITHFNDIYVLWPHQFQHKHRKERHEISLDSFICRNGSSDAQCCMEMWNRDATSCTANKLKHRKMVSTHKHITWKKFQVLCQIGFYALFSLSNFFIQFRMWAFQCSRMPKIQWNQAYVVLVSVLVLASLPKKNRFGLIKNRNLDLFDSVHHSTWIYAFEHQIGNVHWRLYFGIYNVSFRRWFHLLCVYFEMQAPISQLAMIFLMKISTWID